MANGFTDYTEKKIVDHGLGKAAWTMPTTVYLALLTSDPTDTGSTTGEISTASTGYARQAITAAMAAANLGTGLSSNGSIITFPQATADWGNIAFFGIMDAATGGNMLWQGSVQLARQILAGDQYVVPVGQLQIGAD